MPGKRAMNRRFIFGFINGLVLSAILIVGQAQASPPTLEDFWEGRAEWVRDQFDVGLPMGESDTVQISSTEYRAYLHASSQSANVIDQCGDPVQFPVETYVENLRRILERLRATGARIVWAPL